MDLNELRTVRRTEREKDSLQHLRDSFYEDVAAYLADLEARRDRAAAEADDPFASQEVRKLTDKIETAEEVSEAIYERRVGKIVKQASFAAADMTADRDGLTQQEAALFDDLVARIKQNKTTVLDILAGEGDATDDSATDPAASHAGTSASDAHPAPAGTSTDETAAEQPENTIPAGSDDDSPSESGPTHDAVSPDAEPGDMLASAMGGENVAEPESDERDSAGREYSERDSAAPGTAAAKGDVPGDDGTENSSASNTAQATKSPSATGEDRTAVESVASPPESLSDGTDMSPEPTNDSTSAVDSLSTADSADHPAPGTASNDAAITDRNQSDAASTTEADSHTTEVDSHSGDNGDGNRSPTTDGGASQLQRTTVRITRDVGAILGVDEREYDLEREDVVTLPATNAEPLVERDAAERLE